MRRIYKIHNTCNEKVYIGQTKSDLDERLEQHHRSAADVRRTAKFQNAIRKYGFEVFRIVLIEECEDHLADERETFWISHYDSYHCGYNSTLGGNSNKGCSEETRSKLKARVISDETRQKMREVKLGRSLSDAHREKLSQANAGRTLTEEHKSKISRSNLNKVVSDETRAKISDAGLGRHVSDETRRKMSESHKGATISQETREKMSKAQKDRPVRSRFSEETRLRMSEAHMGRTLSEETRKKISETKRRKFLEAQGLSTEGNEKDARLA